MSGAAIHFQQSSRLYTPHARGIDGGLRPRRSATDRMAKSWSGWRASPAAVGVAQAAAQEPRADRKQKGSLTDFARGRLARLHSASPTSQGFGTANHPTGQDPRSLVIGSWHFGAPSGRLPAPSLTVLGAVCDRKHKASWSARLDGGRSLLPEHAPLQARAGDGAVPLIENFRCSVAGTRPTAPERTAAWSSTRGTTVRIRASRPAKQRETQTPWQRSAGTVMRSA